MSKFMRETAIVSLPSTSNAVIETMSTFTVSERRAEIIVRETSEFFRDFAYITEDVKSQNFRALTLFRPNSLQLGSYYGSIRELMDACYGTSKLECKKQDEELKMFAVTCHIQVLMRLKEFDFLKCNSYEELLAAFSIYPDFVIASMSFIDVDIREKEKLLRFSNALSYSLKIVPADACKGVLFYTASRMEGRLAKYINGGGATLTVRRRQYILEKMSGLEARKRKRRRAVEIAEDNAKYEGVDNSVQNKRDNKVKVETVPDTKDWNESKDFYNDTNTILTERSTPIEVKNAIIAHLKATQLLDKNVSIDAWWDSVFLNTQTILESLTSIGSNSSEYPHSK